MNAQKYALEPDSAILGKDGLAEKPGWLTIYHAAPTSREFLGATLEYLMEGVGLPASSYPEAPKFPDSHDMAVCRSADGKYWEIVPDYRGKIAYNTLTQAQIEITEIGELPGTMTFKKPDTDYDKWNGKEWVVDKDLLKSHQINEAKQQQAARLQQANETLSLLQDSVDLEVATDSEKAALLEWKKYRVLLSRVDTSQAPDVEWPEVPE
ncbi:tail fiber assembly protein [Photorhabdus khanii]|uniref:Phage tail protein n=1 Tax=Photorhabdus khanii subsp. guanajuatensis TaxID=2100166 RepID=A0A4V2X8Y7_9GAMM|nr:tail fiber assembly protein [Photorhabdus khanii]TDB61665.1 phage tail protein [Photorhabdus khanii subsp. guanajuatensis]